MAAAQLAIQPRPSPLAIVAARYKDSYLKITYSQPHKRGRAVFGSLVPFGQIWRTGANETTELTITRDITLNGSVVKAGTYSLFTIPEKNEWTIIVNSDVGQWGSYTYNQKLDVLRFTAPVQLLTDVVYEPFTITFEQHNEKGDLILCWDKTKVSVPLQFTEPKTP